MAKPKEIFLAQGKTGGAVTNQQLVPPGDNLPGTKQRVVVDRLYATMSGAGTVQLVNGETHGTVLTPAFNLAAGIPLDIKGHEVMKSEPGEGIDLTTTGAVAAAYMLFYHYE